MTDSSIASSINWKPLVLIPDSEIQRNPRGKGVPYNAPVTLPQDVFNIVSGGATRFGKESGFEFIDKPAYEVYESDFFTKDNRKAFWQPILEAGYPIYVVNPYCGLIWPGDCIGLYNLNMEQVFWYWRATQLWRVTLELYLRNKCNLVHSYLPPIYDNVVRLVDTPWRVLPKEDFAIHTEQYLNLSQSTLSLNTERKRPNIITRLKDSELYKRYLMR